MTFNIEYLAARRQVAIKRAGTGYVATHRALRRQKFAAPSAERARQLCAMHVAKIRVAN